MANKVYLAEETARTWSDAGTTSDELLDLGGLAAGSVQGGSYWDLGAAPRAARYKFELFIDGFDTAPVVGEVIDLYVVESDDASNFTGEPTTDPGDATAATVTENQLANAKYVGSVTVVSTTAGDNLRGIFTAEIHSRYIAPVVVNNTADALLSTADAHMLTVTPIPPEIQ